MTDNEIYTAKFRHARVSALATTLLVGACFVWLTLKTDEKQILLERTSNILEKYEVLDEGEDNNLMALGLEDSFQGIDILSEEQIQKVAGRYARPFTVMTGRSWCAWPPKDNRTSPEVKRGLMFVKTPFTASTPFASATTRVSTRPGKTCPYHIERTANPGAILKDRYRGESFLWTSVRHPAYRALSVVYNRMISVEGQNATDAAKMNKLLKYTADIRGTVSRGQGGFQLHFNSFQTIPVWSAWVEENPETVIRPNQVRENVRQVIQDYDFIAVADRFDESMVALQLLLGIDNPAEIMVFSKRVKPPYIYDTTSRSCRRYIPMNPVQKVQDFLLSKQWIAENYGDYLLHAAASKSLDQTIVLLGTQRFQNALQRYRNLRNQAEFACYETIRYPCSVFGAPQLEMSRKNCYQNEIGCGYPCLDEWSANLTRPTGGQY